VSLFCCFVVLVVSVFGFFFLLRVGSGGCRVGKSRSKSWPGVEGGSLQDC
jgi:hypothetical protein